MRIICNLFISATPPYHLVDSVGPIYALLQLSRPMIDRIGRQAEFCRSRSLHSLSWLDHHIRWDSESEFGICGTRCQVTVKSITLFAINSEGTDVAISATVPLVSISKFKASGNYMEFITDFAWDAHDGGSFPPTVMRAIGDKSTGRCSPPETIHGV